MHEPGVRVDGIGHQLLLEQDFSTHPEECRYSREVIPGEYHIIADTAIAFFNAIYHVLEQEVKQRRQLIYKIKENFKSEKIELPCYDLIINLTMKILVVDDSITMRKLVRQTLEENNIEIESLNEARNGLEAVNLYRTIRPDVVTMDLTMPEMDGLEAISELIKIDADARIVVVSAISHKKTVLEALKLGAKHFIMKPIDKKKFLAALKLVSK